VSVGRRPTKAELEQARGRPVDDLIGPGLRLLFVGINPGLWTAAVNAHFARPGNRFWPAALAAGLLRRDRDPLSALVHHGVGMTDLVKRATARADALSAAEYRDGMARVERLVRWLAPGAVCMVGLGGWRAAVDPRATPGIQPGGLGGRPVYLMPSTSGANAHTSPAELTEHLVRAAACAPVSAQNHAPGIHDHAQRLD
jgi:double-stranded uracil-DNA glycosylase